MKFKKYSYILVFVLILFAGINRTYALTYDSKTCYYMSNDGQFKTRLQIQWDAKVEGWDVAWTILSLGIYNLIDSTNSSVIAGVTIDKVGENNYTNNADHVSGYVPDMDSNCIKGGKVCFETRYKSAFDASNQRTEPTCPSYMVFQSANTYYTWVTDDKSLAQTAQTEIRNQGLTGYYGSLTTKENYYSEFVSDGLIVFDKGEPACKDYEELFGDANDPQSIRYMLNEILQYVRIIVPILIIVLGIIDFSKAVLAGKEDQMKKAQSDFVKRLLMGVAVFFVPVLVDIIMYLANIVWAGQYPINCDFL